MRDTTGSHVYRAQIQWGYNRSDGSSEIFTRVLGPYDKASTLKGALTRTRRRLRDNPHFRIVKIERTTGWEECDL